MEPKILEFLNSHRISVLSTLLKDGSPHAATVHFAHNPSPFAFYFLTDNTSLKCENLLEGNISKASLVIGFSEEEWLTLQMHGTIQLVKNKDELLKIQEIYFAKFPESAKYKDDPTTVFLIFTPTWWRYSDYNVEPPVIIEDKE